MIRTTITPGRRKAMRGAIDLCNPSEAVYVVLEVDYSGATLVPVTEARELLEWLGRVQGYLGVGFPTVLLEFRSHLHRALTALEHHPAMYGHGMLGYQRPLPITCWTIEGARRPGRLYSLHPEGVEGCLVMTPDRQDHNTRVTYWTFEPMPHGGIRPDTTMFRSAFATRSRHDPSTAEAALQALRAEVLGGDEADSDPATISEDGSHLP